MKIEKRRQVENKNLQSFSEIIETTARNGVVPVAISNVKLLKGHVTSLKKVSLYIYTDLGLKT